MIIEEYVDIKINKSNYNYYNSILNNIEKDKVCKIPIKILKRGSHIKILVSCDIFYDKRYPTMDHKISIYYGFENKIDHYIIANIDNIVITKRSINSSKSTKSNF